MSLSEGRTGEAWEPSKDYDFIFNIIILSGVRLSPLGTAATTGLLYQPHMINDGDCGALVE
jgi:hypothetical protein